MLVAEAMGEGATPRPLCWAGVLPDTQAAAAAELLGVASVLARFEGAAGLAAGDLERLRSRGAGLVATLVAAQRDDGGWSWTGGRQDQASSLETSCESLLALAAARRAGLAVPAATLEAGAGYLDQAFRSIRRQARELKAMVVHARAVLGRPDFPTANALHRERASLSPAGLAHLILAWSEMGRRPMAAELVPLLAERLGDDGAAAVAGNLSWNRSPIEMTALALLALQAAAPEHPRAAAAADWLLGRRPWWPARARGLAVAALAARERGGPGAAERFTVEVRLPGGEVRRLELGPDRPDRLLELPLAAGADRVEVELRLEGRGRPHYSAVLRGFVADLDAGADDRFRIHRRDFLAPQTRYRGRRIPEGFSVLTEAEETWRNTIESLPLGGLGRVEVIWSRNERTNAPEEERDFLVLEVPLPAGARVLADSVQGSFLSWEERDGYLVVWLGTGWQAGWLNFEIAGALPGDYRVLPAALRSAYEPERLALSEPAALRVLGRGRESADPYRPTPDELYHLGLARHQAGDAEGAWTALAALYDRFGDRLREDRLREAATALLFLAIDRGEPRAIVRFFEILKEKNPDLTIDFERVLAVGRAYRELEEYERALLIFRAVVEETFGKDLKVAGALAAHRETAESLAVLDRLWREYPDLPVVVESWLTLSDQLLTAAPRAAADDSLKRAGLDRAALSLRGISLLRLFLALYAEDPLAADAGLNLVSAYLGLEDHETTAELAGELAGRFTAPEYADAFTYTRAVAEWYLGREEEALGLLEGIAAAEYPREGGGVRPSPNRELALYILGQIHHARREVAAAEEYYGRVAEVFRDAREALADLREKRISLPEVTVAEPGGRVELEIEHRNLGQADLLVYAVDLMTLYLREKDLSRVTEVNLAGIEPELRTTVALGGTGELLPTTRKVALELPDPGAYLVICRGDELHASGLVLVSDLELRVKEDPVAGGLRVQALSRKDHSFLRDVDVRVVGSASGSIQLGRTDPRGIFVAEGVAGTATVIARGAGGHYAFYRGTTPLAVADARREQDRAGGLESGDDGLQQEGAYLRNVLDFNSDNQARRMFRLKAQVEAERKGVQVKKVK
ncbi:MAG: hypothetical protein D6702_05480 [Planctomycetota bacterium]|nr:MAG: hypothetical protein D6702_05480 [Planctomycetota bacterium]